MKYAFTLLFSLIALCGCGDGTSVGGDEEAYDGAWPCFNGMQIVSLGGSFGLVRDDGEKILPPVYDEIDFLDDRTALLRKDGAFALADTEGRILSKSTDRQYLENNYADICRDVLQKDAQSWDAVIESFYALARRCRNVPAGIVGSKEWKTLQMLRSDLALRLETATGRPTARQEARLREIGAEYE